MSEIWKLTIPILIINVNDNLQCITCPLGFTDYNESLFGSSLDNGLKMIFEFKLFFLFLCNKLELDFKSSKIGRKYFLNNLIYFSDF